MALPTKADWVQMAETYRLNADTTIERRGDWGWAVVRFGRYNLNREGSWEYEPVASERSVDFLSRTRYSSKEEAYSVWDKKTIVVKTTAVRAS